MKAINKSFWLPLILIVLLTLGLAACGKKGPPITPDDDEPKQKSANRSTYQ